jgi:hypothetical protein
MLILLIVISKWIKHWYKRLIVTELIITLHISQDLTNFPSKNLSILQNFHTLFSSFHTEFFINCTDSCWIHHTPRLVHDCFAKSRQEHWRIWTVGNSHIHGNFMILGSEASLSWAACCNQLPHHWSSSILAFWTLKLAISTAAITTRLELDLDDSQNHDVSLIVHSLLSILQLVKLISIENCSSYRDLNIWCGNLFSIDPVDTVRVRSN